MFSEWCSVNGALGSLLIIGRYDQGMNEQLTRSTLLGVWLVIVRSRAYTVFGRRESTREEYKRSRCGLLLPLQFCARTIKYIEDA